VIGNKPFNKDRLSTNQQHQAAIAYSAKQNSDRLEITTYGNSDRLYGDEC
jgi:hypothetical protein